MIKIYYIKTDIGFYISDTIEINETSYDYMYHTDKIKNYYFDDILPEVTFKPHWYKLNMLPEDINNNKVYKLVDKQVNIRYELNNKNLIEKGFKEILTEEECNNENIKFDVSEFYSRKYDYEKVKNYITDIELIQLCEVSGFKEPNTFNYTAVLKDKKTWDDKVINITNNDINHQVIDKIIFPSLLHYNKPCSISSNNLYGIVRQYIIDNIDNKVAKITSNYDFCFTVKKIIPLLAPEKVSYQKLFARTKKERAKIHIAIKEYKEEVIFEMTPDTQNYKDYPVLEAIYANSEDELKEKIDNFLTNLINVINEPLHLCPHCNGSGYENKTVKKGEK
jgi:hypothetical protein